MCQIFELYLNFKPTPSLCASTHFHFPFSSSHHLPLSPPLSISHSISRPPFLFLPTPFSPRLPTSRSSSFTFSLLFFGVTVSFFFSSPPSFLYVPTLHHALTTSPFSSTSAWKMWRQHTCLQPTFIKNVLSADGILVMKRGLISLYFLPRFSRDFLNICFLCINPDASLPPFLSSAPLLKSLVHRGISLHH